MTPEFPLTELCTFVLEKAADEMPLRRARLYRSLASIAGDCQEARELIEKAHECEELESHCRQLVMDFKRRAGG